MRRPRPRPLAFALALAALASCRAEPARDDAPRASPGLAPAAAPPRPTPAAAPAAALAQPKRAAPSDVPLGARLRRAFAGYETLPDRATLERLADAERLVPALVELTADEHEPPHKRANALASLRFFAESPAARAELEARAGDATSPRLLRRTAARALAQAYGDDALPTLAPLLESADPDLRDATARALGASGSTRSRELLERRVSVEADPNVRLSLRRSLPQR